MLHIVVRAVLEIPILLFLLVFAVLWVFRPWFSTQRGRRLARITALVGVAALAGLSCINVIRPGFLWGDEPNIIGVSAAWLQGGKMYLSPSAPQIYSLLYGPCTFLVYAVFLRFTDVLAPLKAGLMTAHLGIVAGMYLLVRRCVDRLTAVELLGVGIMCLLPASAVLYGLRADSWLLLALVWAMVAAVEGDGLAAAAVTGILLGVALNFKLTILFVAAGIVALVYAKQRWRGALVAMVGLVVSFVVPFLTSRISLVNYFTWLNLSRKQGFEPSLLSENVLFATLLIVPALVLHVSREDKSNAGPFPGPYRIAAVCFAIGMLIAIVTGAKSGAGPWHLWPLLPPSLIWLRWEAARVKQQTHSAVVLVALVLAAGVVNLRYSYRYFSNVRPNEQTRQLERKREAELRRIAASYPEGRLSMGYGRQVDDRRTSGSYLLLLNRQEYVVDVNAVAELSRAHLALSPALIRRILACEDLWLVPHGEVPFSTQALQPLPWTTDGIFPLEVRSGFAQNHRIIDQGQYFDIWGCNS